MSRRLDRTGEPLDDDADVGSHRCDRGWVGTDDEGRPVPCLVCRPHLATGRADVNDFGDGWP